MEEVILIKQHKFEDLVREAIDEAEMLYPGENLSAEVEMNETFTIIIKVFRGTLFETKIH
jgi:hypothetical protein